MWKRTWVEKEEVRKVDRRVFTVSMSTHGGVSTAMKHLRLHGHATCIQKYPLWGAEAEWYFFLSISLRWSWWRTKAFWGPWPDLNLTWGTWCGPRVRARVWVGESLRLFRCHMPGSQCRCQSFEWPSRAMPDSLFLAWSLESCAFRACSFELRYGSYKFSFPWGMKGAKADVGNWLGETYSEWCLRLICVYEQVCFTIIINWNVKDRNFGRKEGVWYFDTFGFVFLELFDR